MIGLAVGALFTAKILLNPFSSSFNPGDHAKAGPLRWLPIERTLLNDLPVSADAERARRSLGGSPPIQAYLMDDNAFLPEGDGFWVSGRVPRGSSTACALTRGADSRDISLRVRALSIEVTNGGAANHVVVSAGWDRVRLDLAPNEVRVVQVSAGSGVPYKPARDPTSFVYGCSVSSSAGFVPFLHDSSNPDSRYLGAHVRVMPIYFNP